MTTASGRVTWIRGALAATAALLLAAGLWAAPRPASEEPKPAGTVSIVGTWEGTLTLPGRSLRVAFRIHPDRDGGYGAVMDSLDQGLHGIPVNTVTFKNAKIRMDLRDMHSFYEGSLTGKDAIKGTWHQNGRVLALDLARTSRDYGLENKQASGDLTPFLGTWEGKLEVPGASLRAIFRIARKADGSVVATMDSPDQMVVGVPVSDVSAQGRRVTLAVTAGARYTGTLTHPGALSGTWEQHGLKIPLDLKRTGSATVNTRPQDPKPPFPYKSVDVTFPDRKAGITLAGTLTLPKTGGPFPAVLLITGSGPQNRNEEILGHRPFLVWADYLTRRGIAVLRVDDRGVGKSGGDFSRATDDDFVNDALAGVAFLKSRSDIAPHEIGLMGHSEGGIVAPKAAVRSKDVAFIVLLEAPGLPGDQIILDQTLLIGKAEGATPAELKTVASGEKRFLDIVKYQPDKARAAAELRKLMPQIDKKITGAALDGQVRLALSPWYRVFVAYDPRPTLEKVTCPVLAVGGSRDLQVPAKQNLAAIAGALKAGGNRNVTIKEFQGLNHLMQPAKTGLPSEYGEIETTVSPKVLKFVGDWILSRVKRTEGPGK